MVVFCWSLIMHPNGTGGGWILHLWDGSGNHHDTTIMMLVTSTKGRYRTKPPPAAAPRHHSCLVWWCSKNGGMRLMHFTNDRGLYCHRGTCLLSVFVINGMKIGFSSSRARAPPGWPGGVTPQSVVLVAITIFWHVKN